MGTPALLALQLPGMAHAPHAAPPAPPQTQTRALVCCWSDAKGRDMTHEERHAAEQNRSLGVQG